MANTRSDTKDLASTLEEFKAALAEGAERTRAWLASPAGKRFRLGVAATLAISAPLVLRSRVFRSTPIGRLIEVAGGAAILIKVAEALRDWEPSVTTSG